MEDFEQALLTALLPAIRAKHGLYVWGICGPQGSGKSTLAAQLQDRLQHLGLSVATLSLDDLYLSRSARQQLAAQVHPLLATRGVPGTHDVARGLALLDDLNAQQPGQSIALPRFDKAQDDPRPESDWPLQQQPLDVLIFEGWCVGVPPQPSAALAEPVNVLERAQDADGRWRGWVNQQLAEVYPALFQRIDSLLFLQIPSWDCVLQWRRQQERETAERGGQQGQGLMSEAQIADFIQHYERISRHAQSVMPQRAQVIRRLAANHGVLEQTVRKVRTYPKAE